MAKISNEEAIKRSIDAFVLEKGAMYEAAVRPMLDELAARIVQDLDAFGKDIVDRDKK